jgi:hypothetical protein
MSQSTAAMILLSWGVFKHPFPDTRILFVTQLTGFLSVDSPILLNGP